MPKYISAQDVIDRYGSTRFSLLGDLDGDGLVEAAAVDAAIADVEAFIDSFIGNRYRLPLPGIVSEDDPSLNTVPPMISNVAVDMVVYRLALDHDQLTEHRSERHREAKAWLLQLTNRQTSLGVGFTEIPTTLTLTTIKVNERQLRRCDTEGLL